MRINKIVVGRYKNLINFRCEFANSNISAFIGNNGSGKSNLLEVITEVFSVAKKHCEDKRYAMIVYPEIWGCEIEYEKDGMIYILKYNKPEVSLLCAGKRLPKSEMNSALPESIIIYYVGETVRQKRTATETLDEKYDNRLKASDNDTFPGYKYIDYYSINDLSLLLLTAVVYRGEYYGRLLDLLKCKAILPEVNIMLKNPKGKKQENADTYWGAKGFVQSFLDVLRKDVSSTKNMLSKYSMYFSSIESFKNAAKNEGEFFTKLKALKNAAYLEWLTIQLENEQGEVFSYEMLSEGEKQLALLFLLTTFTAQDNCLYIFDEFDAYLHLNWQRQMSKLLNDIQVNGHIIFTTHSPATISRMQRENVYKMQNGKVSKPLSDTFNRSLDELMEEQMEVPMRPPEYSELVQDFRNAIMHNRKELALAKLDQIKEFVGDNDPFFITARIAMERMETD